MKQSILLTPIFAVLFLFQTLSAHSQSEHSHSVVVETGAFTADELQQLSDHLTEGLSMKLAGGCKSEGLVLIEVPVSLGMRISHAENSILQAINTVWNREANITNQASRETVMNCISED